MPKISGVAAVSLTALWLTGAPASAQVRGMGEIGGGLGAAGGAGVVVTMPRLPDINLNSTFLKPNSAPPIAVPQSAPALMPASPPLSTSPAPALASPAAPLSVPMLWA